MKKKIIRVVQASDENILNVLLKTPQQSATKTKTKKVEKKPVRINLFSVEKYRHFPPFTVKTISM